jgi:hypothetical protein
LIILAHQNNIKKLKQKNSWFFCKNTLQPQKIRSKTSFICWIMKNKLENKFFISYFFFNFSKRIRTKFNRKKLKDDEIKEKNCNFINDIK